mmetsp:Transcript_15386/g.33354  ORF Transcript_15386/g.33354 Transcript_15386/m.33354 type:complete len:676 (+) Transcript_15386:115-2142(+)
MFDFLTSTFPYPSLLVMVVLTLVLRFTLRSLALDLSPCHGNLEPHELSETTHTTPPYLACASDDEEFIGGNQIYLSPPRGPSGKTLTYRVFTPPSFDKEIPKVDMYGAINFVRTGKVRAFVPTGARRLLVINLHEMTLAVHVPRVMKKKKPSKSQRRKVMNRELNSSSGVSSLFSDYDHAASPSGRISQPGGINISIKKATNVNYGLNKVDPGNVEDSEDAWNSQNFDPMPTILHRLDDLVSVTAVPPRHGGVVEIISRNPFVRSDRDKIPNAKPSKLNGGSAGRKPVGQWSVSQGIQQTLQQTECGSVTNYCWLDQVEPSVKNGATDTTTGLIGDHIGGTATNIAEDNDRTSQFSAGERRDEFIFRTPCDAAEFQRIIMMLRTAGREISFLYESLEANQAPLEVSPEEMRRTKEATHTFFSPGVALDSAWHCLNEIPILRKGLYHFHLSFQFKERIVDRIDSNNNGIPYDHSNWKTLLRKAGTHQKQRPLLGLVDFFSLFVPPLPVEDSHAIPYFTPSAKTDLFENNPELILTRGIEWHYQRLSFVSALQRLVSRAALYVRVHAWSRIISHDGYLHKSKPKLDEGDLRDDESEGGNGVAAKSYGNEGRENHLCKRLRQNCRDDHLFHDRDTRNQVASIGDAEAFVLGPVTISNSNYWSPPLVNCHHQGYVRFFT